MEKLLVLLNKELIDELVLDKNELVLGRDTSNDFQLNDPSVSRRHARLKRIMSDYLIEDLESTNGTSVNGKPVSKQMLKTGDVIKLGKFQLRYEKDAEVSGAEPAEAVDSSAPKAVAQEPTRSVVRKALLHFVAGPEEGRTEELRKGLFTIGRPGAGVGTVAARSQGFFLLHLGGEEHPKVNGKEVERGGAPLQDGDLIEVGEHRVRISIQQDE